MCKNNDMARKHFMIYYQQGAGTYVVTEPMPWARENINLFKSYGYDFKTKNPTPNEIEKILIDNFNFKLEVKNDKILLIQNLDPNLTFDL